MAGFNMDDYVDVAERIREFYERYPDGSLQSGQPPAVLEVGGKPFIVYHALAYRTPEDPKPAHGWAWEPVPGPTQFTKDSELMNAETAAWGRAIVALGFATKKIASAQEVRNRSGNGNPAPQAAPTSPAKLPTKQDEVELLALIADKDGDVPAATAAMVAARATDTYADWFAFQRTHWEKQPKPFRAPAGVKS